MRVFSFELGVELAVFVVLSQTRLVSYKRSHHQRWRSRGTVSYCRSRNTLPLTYFLACFSVYTYRICTELCSRALCMRWSGQSRHGRHTAAIKPILSTVRARLQDPLILDPARMPTPQKYLSIDNSGLAAQHDKPRPTVTGVYWASCTHRSLGPLAFRSSRLHFPHQPFFVLCPLLTHAIHLAEDRSLVPAPPSSLFSFLWLLASIKLIYISSTLFSAG